MHVKFTEGIVLVWKHCDWDTEPAHKKLFQISEREWKPSLIVLLDGSIAVLAVLLPSLVYL